LIDEAIQAASKDGKTSSEDQSFIEE